MRRSGITVRQLELFVAVTRFGSTTAAAREAALSQSAVSAAVQELERVLGHDLFDRVGRRLAPNEEGRRLYPEARALLDRLTGIETRFGDAASGLGTLRIGASTTIGSYLLPTLMAPLFGADLQAERPLQSRVMISNTADICEAVADYAIDIGLIEGPNHQPEVATRPWLEDELVIVAARGSMPARLTVRGGPVRAADLNREVWLLREPGSGTREVADRAILERMDSYRRSIELPNSEAIKRAVALGVGIACLSRWIVADELRSGQLVELRTDLPRISRRWFIAQNRERQPTAATDLFLAALPRPATARPE